MRPPNRQSFSGAGIPASPQTTGAFEPASRSNLQLYNQVIPSSGVMAMDSGSFFFLLSSGVTLNITVMYAGGTEQFNGAPVGLQLARVKSWTRLQIAGTPGATISFIHGYSYTRQDFTNFQATIATIAGSVTTVPGVGSSNALTYHADVTVAATTLDTTIAANALRKFLIVGSLSNNAPGAGLNLRVQGGPGTAANEGLELQSGTNYQFPIQAAFAIYNPAAVSQKYWYVEVT